MKKNYNDYGFTLIELAIVIAIVSVVTAFAVGGYLSWKPGFELRGAVSQVRADLNRTKMRAVETRRQCRVVFTANGYQIEDGDRVMNSTVAGWGNIDTNGVHTPGIPFRVVNFNDFPQVILTKTGNVAIPAPSDLIIAFSPRGIATTIDTIEIRNRNIAGATVAVNLTGRINITWL